MTAIEPIEKELVINNLPQYESRKVVRMAKVERVAFDEATDTFRIYVDFPGKTRPTYHVVDKDTFYKRGFAVGGFVIFYKDGYVSFCPDDEEYQLLK